MSEFTLGIILTAAKKGRHNEIRGAKSASTVGKVFLLFCETTRINSGLSVSKNNFRNCSGKAIKTSISDFCFRLRIRYVVFVILQLRCSVAKGLTIAALQAY